MNGRHREELIWRLFRSFFRSRTKFLALFNRYEERIRDFSSRYQSHRSRLRLPVDELLTVLDPKSLEELRDREISDLKDLSHGLFRDSDRTDRFDHHVANIYHEISMLKEEHYTLREEYLRSDSREYGRFFREVSEFYPKRLRHVRNLYGKALRRLEELLPSFSQERILLRSLYFFGEELLERNYPRGVIGIYRRMFATQGEVRALFEVGVSFLDSGFEEEALEAFERARKAAESRWARRRSEEIGPLAEDIRARVALLKESLATDAQV